MFQNTLFKNNSSEFKNQQTMSRAKTLNMKIAELFTMSGHCGTKSASGLDEGNEFITHLRSVSNIHL